MAFHRSTEAAQQRLRVLFMCCHYPEDAYYGQEFEKLIQSHDDLQINKPQISQQLEWTGGDQGLRTVIRDTLLVKTDVVVVLIGANTWRTHQTDWVLAAAMEDNAGFVGVLGLVLPTHPDFHKTTYSSGVLPPRIADNMNMGNGFVALRKWSDDADVVMGLINEASTKKQNLAPNNQRALMKADLEGSFWV